MCVCTGVVCNYLIIEIRKIHDKWVCGLYHVLCGSKYQVA